MKHLFIINPVSGKLKPEQKLELIHASLERLPDRLRENNQFSVYVTRGPMDACERIIQEAEDGEPLRVYACGGDGTLNECVNGAALRENVAVTHFPCGTGNDFIKMFGDEKRRFFDLAELIGGEIHPIDLIKCNDRYSLNICSVGIDARVGTDVHKYSKLPLIGGAGGYVASLVVNYVKGLASRMTVRADGLVCGPELNMVCVCNGCFYGGGFNPTNDARPDDGLMDVLIVSGVSRLSFIGTILTFAAGKYKNLPKYITYLRTDRVVLDAEQEEVINIDGELARGRTIEFSMVPAGVNFIFPRNMSFFA